MSNPTMLRRLLHTFLTPLVLAVPLARAADDLIARVGDQEIKSAQVAPYLENLSGPDRTALLKNPAALSQAVRTLILQQILLKEAIAAGWDKTPEVAEQLDRPSGPQQWNG